MNKKNTDPNNEKSLTDLLTGQSEQTQKETSPEAKPEAKETDVKDSQEETKENEEEKSTEDSEENLDEQSDVNKDNKNEEGKNELFWGKFKTDEDAKKAYTNAERKITEQARELNEIRESNKSTEAFLEVLNKAIESNPELHKQLEAEISKVVNGNPSEEKVDNIDDLIEKKLEQRERQRAEIQSKEKEVEKIVNFFKEHPETTLNDEKLGNEILDYIEEKNLPCTLDTVELVYTKMTQDVKTKEIVDKELKAKKVKDLERINATSVGKDGNGGGEKPKVKSSLSDLIGDFQNPNSL